MSVVRSIVVTLALASLATPSLAAPSLGECPVFPADNAWNTPIDTLPVHPSSAVWVNTIGASVNAHPDFGSVYLGDPIGIPFVTVPATQPLVTVTFDTADESDPGPYP